MTLDKWQCEIFFILLRSLILKVVYHFVFLSTAEMTVVFIEHVQCIVVKG